MNFRVALNLLILNTNTNL